MMFKKYRLIFLLAFLLNLIWENLHVVLYVHYQGQPITELVLLRATLFDAVFITLLLWLVHGTRSRRTQTNLIILISLVFAIGLEIFALQTGRWDYNSLMPIIPFLEVGLSPAIQLPFLAWVVQRLSSLQK